MDTAHSDEARALVDLAYEARRTGTNLDLLPGEIDEEQAFALQLAVADRFVHDGEDIGGWKMAMTSGAMRDSMGVGFRPFGYVLSSRIFGSGEHVVLPPNAGIAIEAELCLMMGSALRGSAVGPDEAAAAVAGVAPSFELVEGRVVASGDSSHATKIVDGISNWGIVIGDQVPFERLTDTTTATLRCDGEEVASATTGVDIEMDDVLLTLSRLCHLLDVQGRGVEAGQAVLTGAFMKLPVVPPSRWDATFSGIGDVAISFA